jgi:hypothetical protein
VLVSCPLALFKNSKKMKYTSKMQEKIGLETIPPHYGGTSMPLGLSPQEITLKELIHNNYYLSFTSAMR